MTFLNATLVLGVMAAAVPIVLHLLAKREPKKVVFPSVRFLVQRFESNRSRLRVRRWWLLALRILALALLALALARPVIHQSLSVTWLTIALIAAFGVALLVMASIAMARGPSKGVAYGLAAAALVLLLGTGIWGSYVYASGPSVSVENNEPVAIAIVFDNAPTSAWRTPDDDRIARMKDVATWMVSRLPRTSRIAILDRSAQVANFSLDASSAVTKIEELETVQVTQPIAARIEAGARLVRTSELTNRQILLITDLATSTWNAAKESGLAAVLAENPAVSVTLFDLGDFEGSNRALTVPEFADVTPPRDTPVALSTTLSLQSNDAGSSDSVTAEVELFDVDPALPVVRNGVVQRPKVRSVDRASVRVAAGGSSELLMTIPSLSTGTHHGRVRLIGDDAMPLDDVRYFSLQVLPPSQILLVADNEDDARVLTSAIVATAGLVDEENAEFAVERIAFSDLTVVRLSDFDTVVLLDPPQFALTDEGVERYLQQGGGVLVCLGPAAGEQPLESSFHPKLVRRWRVPDPGTFFQVDATRHPVTEPLSAETPWSSFRVSQYWQVQTDSMDKTLIQYAGTQNAAVVERSVSGESQGTAGRLIVITTPVPALSRSTRDWNDLFGFDPWPAWLLCRQCIEYLTRRDENDLMPQVGQSHSIRLGAAASEGTPQRVQLFPPSSNTPIPLEIAAGADRVTVRDVPLAGTYWVRGLEPGAGFAANLSNRAIELDRIDEGELDTILGPDQFSLASNLEEIQFAENRASQRVSLHSPAILLALAAFLLEQLLSNRFYSKRASPVPA